MGLVRFFDFIGEKMGQAFGIVFKIIVPFLVTALPIDRVCAFTMRRFELIADGILLLGFLVLLILYPRIASVAEFVIIGFALVFTIGFGTIHTWWAWMAMGAAMLFIFFKILFLFAIMIKRADAMDAADRADQELDDEDEQSDEETAEQPA